MRTDTEADRPTARNGGRSRERWPGWFVLASLATLMIAVLILSSQQPLTADDFANLGVLRQHPSLWGYLAYWYGSWTGRMTGIALLWAALKTPALFAIANGIAFASLPALMFVLATGRAPRHRTPDWIVLGTLTAALWFSLPAIAQTVFWTSGTVTYLWSIVLMLAGACAYRRWLSSLERTSLPPSPWYAQAIATLGMFVWGVAVGASHEQIFAATCLLAVAFVVRIARAHALARVPPRLWAGLVGFAAGAIVLLASPGNAARAALSAPAPLGVPARLLSFANYAGKAALSWMAPSYAWLLALLLVGVLYGASARSDGREPRPWSSVIWALAAAASLGVFIAEPRIALLAGERTTMFAVVLLAIAALSVGRMERHDDSPSARIQAGAATRAAGVVVALILVLAIADAGVGILAARSISSQIAARDRLVAEQVRVGSSDIVVPPLSRGGSRTVFWGDIHQDPEYWINVAVARVYHVRSIRLAGTARP